MPQRAPVMPYIDTILDQLERQNSAVRLAFGRHVHWGYWDRPDTAEISAEGFRAASDEMSRQALLEIRLVPGARVVDAGCGFGGTLALLNESHEGLALTGLNIDNRQLERARREVVSRPGSGNKIDFVAGDACAMPLEAGVFDLVLALECTFHFSSRGRFIEEAYRCLKPGGRLVISDFVAYAPTRPILEALFHLKRHEVHRIFGDVRRPRSVHWFREQVDRKGFEKFTSRDITSHTLPTYKIMQLLAREFGDRQGDFAAVHHFIEEVARLRLYRYCIMTADKPLTR